MTVTIPALPLEIYKEIIDHFAACISQYSPSPEDLDTLHCISIACYMFLPLARAHIFRRIDISGDHDPTGARRKSLVAFLEREPGIARNVEAVLYSFCWGDEQLTQDPLKEVLQCITTSLPCIKTLSIVMKPASLATLLRIRDIRVTPTFGWENILEEFISKQVVLDTLSIVGDKEFVPFRVPFIPPVRRLVLDHSTLDCVRQEQLQRNLEANRYTLTAIQCHSECCSVSFDFISQCTRLSELKVAHELRYHSLNTDYPVNELPFQKLTKAEFGDGYRIEWGFFFACAATRGAGSGAFPALTDLTMGLQAWGRPPQKVATDSLIYEVFKHMPVLETLKINGGRAVGLDFSRALNPLSTTLKTLSLHCDFQDKAFLPWPGAVEVAECLQTLENLNLAALQSFFLHIQLETGIYDRDRSTNPPMAIYRAVAKSAVDIINNVFLSSYGTRFCSLSRVDVKLTMMVYEKEDCDELEDEEPYRRKAVKAMKRYLSGIDVNGKFEFMWEVEVFRRSIGRGDMGDEGENGEHDDREDVTSDEEKDTSHKYEECEDTSWSDEEALSSGESVKGSNSRENEPESCSVDSDEDIDEDGDSDAETDISTSKETTI